MANTKKLIQAAAGAAGGAGGLNVEEVFSTYLYDGNDAAQTITNGIDLSGEGGLVWLKNRGFTVDGTTGITDSHQLIDTERGASYRLSTNTTSGNNSATNYFSSFNSDGFTVGTNMSNGFDGGHRYTSWTFRKAPKFFDVVTYTGDGVAGKTVSHNLGSVPGCIIVKRLDASRDWIVFHRSLNVNGDNAPETDGIILQSQNPAFDSSSIWNDTAPTSTDFTLGDGLSVNASGSPHVAYLFAHNDGDGEFGDGTQDIIKCGSYTGNGSTSGPEIDLGFEPQWVMIKRSSGLAPWRMYDNMRGIVTGDDDSYLSPNLSDAETSAERIELTPTGFKAVTTTADTNSNGSTYIYIAIRRGPMAVPEDATDVFAIDTRGGTSPTPPAYYSGFPVDLQVWKSSITASNNWEARDRLRGTYGRVKLNLTDAEDSNGGNEFFFDQMLGQGSATGTNTSRYSWMWKRAPNYFDVVAYTGNGTRGLTVSHNLGVAPEMMWVKGRDNAFDWTVYHKDAAASGTVAESSALELNNTNAVAAAGYVFWDNTAPTSSVITLGNNAQVNQSGYNYIAYLFASVDGVSKVGSYTGNGSSNGDSQNIDCGFSSGARLVLIKRTDNTGNWLLFDTSRGIVSSGNDPALLVNSTGSNFTGFDFLEPNSNGVNVLYNDVSSSYNPNISGANYIFYAIA